MVHEHAGILAPMAVDAVCKLVDPARDSNVNLDDIRIVKKLGETTEDSKLIDGIIFTQKSEAQTFPKKIEKAKIGLIQFCISPPKTDVSMCCRKLSIKCAVYLEILFGYIFFSPPPLP